MRKKAYRYTKDDQVFIYQMLVLRTNGLSYPQIGKLYNKDHSTVIHWCRRFNVDIGKPLLTHAEFDIKINKKTSAANKYKYFELLNEPINKGKKNYQAYLEEYKQKTKRSSPLDIYIISK
jgi:hypothetical protein